MPKIWRRKKKGDSIIYMLYLQVTKQLDHPAVWHHRAKTSGWLAELFIFIKIFCPPLDNTGASHVGVRGICTCLHMQRHLQWQTKERIQMRNARSYSSLASGWIFLTMALFHLFPTNPQSQVKAKTGRSAPWGPGTLHHSHSLQPRAARSDPRHAPKLVAEARPGHHGRAQNQPTSVWLLGHSLRSVYYTLGLMSSRVISRKSHTNASRQEQL